MCSENCFCKIENSKYMIKTDNIKPCNFTRGSNKKALFKCPKCNHSFECIINRLSRKGWCKYCGKKELCKDMNCLFCFFASVMSQPGYILWDYKRNIGKPRDYFRGSEEKKWFKCANNCGHSIERYIYNINLKCMYCISQKLCNDLSCLTCFIKSFASHPKSAFWDYTKNEKLPVECFKFSNKKYWFKCKNCNHSFRMALNTISQGGWCKYCGKRELCENLNCLFCLDASFSSETNFEWIYEKNEGSPRNYFKNSTYKAWLKCKCCKHEIKNKLHNIKCGYCNGANLCLNDECDFCYNKSFASTILNDLIWSGDNPDSPRANCKFSKIYKIFECKKCENIFEARLYNVSYGTGCPSCLFKNECETREIFEILTGFEFPKCSQFLDGKYELDGFCEELAIAFEYNGQQHYDYIEYFHRNGEHELLGQQIRDEIKRRLCKQQNIHLIEVPYWIKNKEKYIWNCIQPILIPI